MLRLPIAHGEGNYYAPPEVIAELEAAGRVVFRYATPPATSRTRPIRTARSTTSPASATSGRNVVGLMPHPERACEAAVGSADGLVLFESVVQALSEQGSLQAVAR